MIRFLHAPLPTRTLLLALSEATLIVLALLAATVAWFGRDAELILTYENGFPKIIVVSLICMLCMHYYDLYNVSVLNSSHEVITRLIQVLGTACLILSLLYFAFPSVQLDRGLFVICIVLAGLALAASRKLFFALNRSFRLTQRVALLGGGPLALPLAAEIESRPDLGLHLLGYVGGSTDGGGSLNGVQGLGAIKNLPAIVAQNRVNRLILTVGDSAELPVETLWQLKTQGVQIEDAADVYEAITGKVPINWLRSNWLLFSPSFCVSSTFLAYKRASALILSVIGLIISLPIMLLVAIAVRLDSRGPAIFRQARVGRDGNLFTLYKFRTMHENSDREESPQPAQEDDARFTRVGRWLRRTRLDEIPQLYNILRGDMCFVGPRPFLPNLEEELAQKIPFYNLRWTVTPGATGWAQINRGYCDSLKDNIEKLGFDLFYIKNASIGLDFLILFQTVKIVLLGRGSR